MPPFHIEYIVKILFFFTAFLMLIFNKMAKADDLVLQQNKIVREKLVNTRLAPYNCANLRRYDAKYEIKML